MTSIQTSSISVQDYEVAAQFAHFFSAYAIVFTLGHFFEYRGLFWGALGMSIWAFVKEFLFDLKREIPLLRGSSFVDFVVYEAGVVAAILVGVPG